MKIKLMNKYQCGNDLDCSPLLNNADKHAKFDNPNFNGFSCVSLDDDLVTLTFDIKLIINKLLSIVMGMPVRHSHYKLERVTSKIISRLKQMDRISS